MSLHLAPGFRHFTVSLPHLVPRRLHPAPSAGRLAVIP
jgi:hypothetical protein